MSGNSTGGRSRWAWRLASLLLLAAVLIDVLDGQWNKLAMSTLLLAACTLAAIKEPPRTRPIRLFISLAFLAAFGLLICRIAGNSL